MFISKVSVLVFTTSALGLMIKRDYSTVYADIQTLNTDAINLKNAVNKYDGGLLSGLSLNSVGNQFDSDMKKAASDCNSSAAFTATQCTQEVSYLNSTFEPSLKAALAALKSKKQTIVNAGLKSQLQSNLNQFKSECDAVITCVKTKCPSAQQTTAQAAITKIDADFTDAINYYKS